MSKKKPKLSKREKWAQTTGGSKGDYKGSIKKKKDDDYNDIIDSILGNTPSQQAVLSDFESTYTPQLQAEDMAQSEALYKPYFEQKIANELEDLNAWAESDSVSYDRSLRRARASLAAQGGAIGSERQSVEGEMATDHTAQKNSVLRQAERTVGTERLNKAGYQSGGQKQEGALVGDMTAAVQEGQLWYKNQRAQRYFGNANTYYQQPTGYSLSGSKM